MSEAEANRTRLYSINKKLSTTNDNSKSDRFFSKASTFDIFAFIPVPKAKPVSTKRSVVGSIVLILIFFAFILYSIYNFLTNNAPRANQILNSLDEEYIVEVPDLAFAFINSDYFNNSFYNSSYWTFTYQQVVIYQNISTPRNYTTLDLISCQPDWLNVSFPVLCPNQTAYMQGVLYGTPINMYARLKVSMCLNSTTNNSCATNDSISWTMMTGRLFVFIKSNPSIDLETGDMETTIPYESYFYFMVWSLYNRAEMVVQRSTFKLHPDFATSFTMRSLENLEITNQNTYISQVPQNVSHDMFLWWMRLDETQMLTDVVYETSTDVIGKWGGLWGVLFSLGAFYFLRYNTRSFYSQKPEWEKFDEKFSEVDQNAKGNIERQSMRETSGVNVNASVELQLKQNLVDKSAKQNLADL